MKIIKAIISIIAIGILACSVALLFMSKSSGLAGFRSYAVLTGSMTPTIPVGSIVIVKKQPTYDKSMIITFTQHGKVVTHRIVGVKQTAGGTQYTTKGDANNRPDDTSIVSSAIAGKYIFGIPYVGFIQGFMRTPPGFLGLIIAPAILFVLVELSTIKKEFEKEVLKKVQTNHEPT